MKKKYWMRLRADKTMQKKKKKISELKDIAMGLFKIMPSKDKKVE